MLRLNSHQAYTPNTVGRKQKNKKIVKTSKWEKKELHGSKELLPNINLYHINEQYQKIY